MSLSDIRIARLAERRHGVFSRAQALGAGLSERAIDGRLDAGVWLRRHRGVYRLVGAPESFHGRVIAALLAAGERSCASHTTAAALWTLRPDASEPVHITVLDRTRKRIDGVVVHRPGNFSNRDVTTLGVVRVTTAERTIIDLGESLDPVVLEDNLDEAIRRGLVDPRRLAKRLRSMSPNGRRGIVTIQRLVDERCGHAVTGSSLENRFRRLLRASHLPQPVEQYEIRVSSGVVARVDFAYPAEKIAVELDGYAFHSGRRRWEADRGRQNKLVQLGWIVLRFTSRQLEQDAASVLSTIAKVLATRGFRVAKPRPAG